MIGNDLFVMNALKIAYGNHNALLQEGRVAGVQTVSGTGANRIGFEFLARNYPTKGAEIMTPTPTWPVHNWIPDIVGMKHKPYRYYN